MLKVWYINLLNNVFLVWLRQMWVDHWEKVDGCKLWRVCLTVHKALNHLDDLLPKIFDIDESQYIFYRFHCLYYNMNNW